jgi:hypothetical protein
VSHPPLELRIDEVAVHGFDPEDHDAIADAVERALEPLLADNDAAGLVAAASANAVGDEAVRALSGGGGGRR